MRRQSRLHVLMILGQAGVGASRWCAPPIASFSPAGTLSLSFSEARGQTTQTISLSPPHPHAQSAPLTSLGSPNASGQVASTVPNSIMRIRQALMTITDAAMKRARGAIVDRFYDKVRFGFVVSFRFLDIAPRRRRRPSTRRPAWPRGTTT
jgi:hypothetical protein